MHPAPQSAELEPSAPRRSRGRALPPHAEPVPIPAPPAGRSQNGSMTDNPLHDPDASREARYVFAYLASHGGSMRLKPMLRHLAHGAARLRRRRQRAHRALLDHHRLAQARAGTPDDEHRPFTDIDRLVTTRFGRGKYRTTWPCVLSRLPACGHQPRGASRGAMSSMRSNSRSGAERAERLGRRIAPGDGPRRRCRRRARPRCRAPRRRCAMARGGIDAGPPHHAAELGRLAEQRRAAGEVGEQRGVGRAELPARVRLADRS